jgi:fibronectin type 3 domain-containing protein
MRTSILIVSMIILCLLVISGCKDDSTTSSTTGTGQNNPPNAPSNPTPADGATQVGRPVSLRWQCTDPDPNDVLTYNVYLSTANPPAQLIVQNHNENRYTYNGAGANTKYYWQIVAHDNNGDSAASQVWNFTTGN